MPPVYLHCHASEAMYDDGSPLANTDQPDTLRLGPFPYIELTYETVRVGPSGEPVGFLVDGVWSIGPHRERRVSGWTEVGPSPDGLLFSDLSIHTQP